MLNVKEKKMSKRKKNVKERKNLKNDGTCVSLKMDLKILL